ncbi:MAG: DciA family protein [bacterium]|nr:DciA family protein [bacterium]
MAGGFQRMDAVIADTLQRLRPPQEILLAQLQSAWPAIVGSVVAENTRPQALENNALVVQVKNHIWLAELRGGLEQGILRTVQQQHAPRIKRILWRVQ